MLIRFKLWLNHINQLPCPRCGSRKTIDTDHDYIEHYVCEYKVCCADCGTEVNYWAYGNRLDPDTYTQLFHMRIAEFRYKVRRLFRSEEPF